MEEIILPVAILTYRRAGYFKQTLESFIEFNRESLSMYRIIVLVQGDMDRGTPKVLKANRKYLHDVMHVRENRGCAGGYLMATVAALKLEQPYIMYLQDDWESRESVSQYVPEIIKMMEEHKEVGYIRLRTITERVAHKNRITRQGIYNKPVSDHIFLTNAHFSMNPQIIRSVILPKFTPFFKEKEGMILYNRRGYLSAQLRAKCFHHIGRKRAVTVLKNGVQKWVK